MTIPVNELPDYLRQFVAVQDYDQYTAIDHASWRYIMRVSKEYFKDHAHPHYIQGLAETGITTETIPRISEMDEQLKKFGWRAVTVTGFIPSEAFLELLSLNVMPIACDMRKLEHIDYTPSPDIVHEAAGHAPIIADKAYASYLKKFGEIARRVIFAKEDQNVYLAVLNLSELKEDPHSTEKDIEQAQKKLDQAQANITYASEAQKLTRLGWWSIEYGLYKLDNNYLIYGAGLLSSVGESYNINSDSVQKLPLDITCTEKNFDITKPQPQLYYTDDFKKLEKIIDELSETMSYKKGGADGLSVAQKAETVTTTELNSGIQISGIVSEFRKNNAKEIYFIKYQGPVQLAYKEKQISGQGPKHHKTGFSFPLGKPNGFTKSLTSMTTQELNEKNIQVGKKCKWEFPSNGPLIHLSGLLESIYSADEKNLIFTFKDCSIHCNEEILYQSDWGPFDLVTGETVVSVFGGAADRGSYIRDTDDGVTFKATFKARPQKINKTKENEALIPLYQKVRDLRATKEWKNSFAQELHNISDSIDQDFNEDWLLRLEIMELLKQKGLATDPLYQSLLRQVLRISQNAPHLNMLVQRGLGLFKAIN